MQKILIACKVVEQSVKKISTDAMSKEEEAIAVGWLNVGGGGDSGGRS